MLCYLHFRFLVWRSVKGTATLPARVSQTMHRALVDRIQSMLSSMPNWRQVEIDEATNNWERVSLVLQHGGTLSASTRCLVNILLYTDKLHSTTLLNAKSTTSKPAANIIQPQTTRVIVLPHQTPLKRQLLLYQDGVQTHLFGRYQYNLTVAVLK